jgi:hypothetical protein
MRHTTRTRAAALAVVMAVLCAGAAPAAGGDLYVLCVEADYQTLNKGKSAPHGVEAEGVAKVLKEKGHFANVHTRVVTGPKADRKSLLGGLDWLRRRVGPGDVAVVFIAMHGSYSGGAGFSVAPAGYRDGHPQGAVRGEEIREALARTAGRKVLLLESCNSGGFLGPAGKEKPIPGTIVITSAKPKESSQWWSLSKAAIDGLGGKAADSRGVVTAAGLLRYVRRDVAEREKGQQHVRSCQPHDLRPIELTRR